MRPVVAEGHQPSQSEEDQVPLQDHNDWIVFILGVQLPKRVDAAVKRHADQVASEEDLEFVALPGDCRGIPLVDVSNHESDGDCEQEEHDEEEDGSDVVDDGVSVSVDSADGCEEAEG